MNTASKENTPEQESLLEDQMSEIRAIEMEGYEIGIRRARNVMYIVAALSTIYAIYAYSQLNGNVNYLFWVLFVCPAVLFFLLAFLTKTKPYLSVLIGLVMYIGFWLLSIVLGGLEGVGGVLAIVIKCVIIFYMVNGLKDAKLIEAAKKEDLQ